MGTIIDSFEKEKIQKLAEMSVRRDELPDVVYHYTTNEIIPLIFLDDCTSFKLTKISKFPDKLEGKCFAVFYDLALEELEQDKIITATDREILETIKPANTGFIYHRKDAESNYYQSGPAITYVGCFCERQSDPRMIKDYIRNKEHMGICIGMHPKSMVSWTHNLKGYGYMVSIKKVLYGREMVDYLKDYLIKLIEYTGGVASDLFSQIGVTMLRSELSSVKYISKTGSFRNESEYRIILQLPIHTPKDYYGAEFEKTTDGILFRIPLSEHALDNYRLINFDDKQLAMLSGKIPPIYTSFCEGNDSVPIE